MSTQAAAEPSSQPGPELFPSIPAVHSNDLPGRASTHANEETQRG